MDLQKKSLTSRISTCSAVSIKQLNSLTSFPRHLKPGNFSCLHYELFNKCPNQSECVFSHGQKCPFCLEDCLPIWNDELRDAHLESCVAQRRCMAKKLCLEAGSRQLYSSGKIIGNARNCEHSFCFYMPKQRDEDKKLFYKKKVPQSTSIKQTESFHNL